MARFIKLHAEKNDGDIKTIYVNVERIISFESYSTPGKGTNSKLLCNNVFTFVTETPEELMHLIHTSGKGHYF